MNVYYLNIALFMNVLKELAFTLIKLTGLWIPAWPHAKGSLNHHLLPNVLISCFLTSPPPSDLRCDPLVLHAHRIMQEDHSW